MPDGGKLTIETANAHLDEALCARRRRRDAGPVRDDRGHRHRRRHAGRACWRARSSRSSPPRPIGQGTGLGLSQVYGFVKQSGGHVKIYSELGARHDGEALPAAHAGAGHRASPTAGARARRCRGTRGERVLVVEDEDDVRAFAVEMLRELGYARARGRGRAERRCRCCEAEPSIRLLFTDVVLPGGMNGRQLADAAQRRRPELKVLFTSGYTRNADRARRPAGRGRAADQQAVHLCRSRPQNSGSAGWGFGLNFFADGFDRGKLLRSSSVVISRLRRHPRA